MFYNLDSFVRCWLTMIDMFNDRDGLKPKGEEGEPASMVSTNNRFKESISAYKFAFKFLMKSQSMLFKRIALAFIVLQAKVMSSA